MQRVNFFDRKYTGMKVSLHCIKMSKKASVIFRTKDIKYNLAKLQKILI